MAAVEVSGSHMPITNCPWRMKPRSVMPASRFAAERAHLGDNVGLAKDISPRGEDRGSLGLVLFVAKAGRLASSGFDQHFEAKLLQGRNRIGNQCHPIFARQRLAHNSDFHGLLSARFVSAKRP